MISSWHISNHEFFLVPHWVVSSSGLTPWPYLSRPISRRSFMRSNSIR